MIAPTRLRKWIDARSHMPPASMLDDTGRAWAGTSRVLDRPARRKAQRRTWQDAKAQARRDYLASTCPDEVTS